MGTFSCCGGIADGKTGSCSEGFIGEREDDWKGEYQGIQDNMSRYIYSVSMMSRVFLPVDKLRGVVPFFSMYLITGYLFVEQGKDCLSQRYALIETGTDEYLKRLPPLCGNCCTQLGIHVTPVFCSGVRQRYKERLVAYDTDARKQQRCHQQCCGFIATVKARKRKIVPTTTSRATEIAELIIMLKLAEIDAAN